MGRGGVRFAYRDGGGPGEVEGRVGWLLGRADSYKLVGRTFGPRVLHRLRHQPRAAVDRIEPRAHRIVARDRLTDATVLDRGAAVQPDLFREIDEQVEMRQIGRAHV